MPGGSVVSAIPDNLINYGIRATLLDGKVSAQATVLGQALSAFINSNPDPKYIPSIPRLDQNVSSLALSAKGTDSWVGRVGEAFRVAAQQEVAFLERHTGATGLDPGTMPTTSTEGQISAWAADMGPAFQQDLKTYVAHQQYAQGRRDAKALIDAYSNPNTTNQQLQAIVGRLKSHLQEPDYNAGYFAALGPRRTLDIAGDLTPGGHGPYPPLPPGNQLPTFDQALAAASHSSLLPGNFVTQVFPHYDLSKLGQSGQRDETANYLDTIVKSTRLLRYGDYSKAFLAQALHTIVMPYMGNPQAALVVGSNAIDASVLQRTNIVLGALARNPSADAQILGSPSTFTRDGRTFGDGSSNIAAILKQYGKEEGLGANPNEASLSAAIAAITKGSNTQDRIAVLKGIGSVPWQDVPNGSRAAIGHALANDISNPAFLQQDNNPYFQDFKDPNLPKDPHFLTWQEKLFIAATTNSDGSKNQASVDTLTAAVKTWLGNNPPPRASSPNFSDWIQHYGSLVGLATLGLRAGPYKSAADAAHRFNVITTSIEDGFGLATAPLSTGASIVVGGLADAASAAIAGHAPTDSNAELKDEYLQSKTRALAESELVATEIYYNPDLLPASVRAAYNTNPKSPDVQNFVVAVVKAGDVSALNYRWDTPQQKAAVDTLVTQTGDLHGKIGNYFGLKFN